MVPVPLSSPAFAGCGYYAASPFVYALSAPPLPPPTAPCRSSPSSLLCRHPSPCCRRSASNANTIPLAVFASFLSAFPPLGHCCCHLLFTLHATRYMLLAMSHAPCPMPHMPYPICYMHLMVFIFCSEFCAREPEK